MAFLPEGWTGSWIDPSCLGSDVLSHQPRESSSAASQSPKQSATCFDPHRFLSKYQHLLGVVSYPGDKCWITLVEELHPAPTCSPGFMPCRQDADVCKAHTLLRSGSLGKTSRQIRRGSHASHSCRDFGRITNKTLITFLTSSQNPLC